MHTGAQKKDAASKVATGVLALACAVALALPAAPAFAVHLPEGSGEFDVSVLTDVLPALDPEAALNDVTVHVSNDAGEHLEAALVSVAIVPPNADAYDPDAAPQSAPDATAGTNGQDADADADDPGASHAVGASGTTSADGRIVLSQAAVGATYRVAATKDGHYDFEGTFSCAGRNGEVWEVVLNRVPDEDGSGLSKLLSTGDALSFGIGAVVLVAVVAAIMLVAAKRRASRKGAGDAR